MGRRKKETTSIKAEIIEKVITTSWCTQRIKIWQNVPPDLVINATTPVGTRLVHSENPETRYFLKRYIVAGGHDPVTDYPYPNGGILVTSNHMDYAQAIRPECLMIHDTKEVKIEVPEEFKYITNGHREGSKAAEKAALREMRKRERQAKIDAKLAKKQARIDAKEAKLKARNDKKQARLAKKQTKENKRLVRLEKKAKRLLKKNKKTTKPKRKIKVK